MANKIDDFDFIDFNDSSSADSSNIIVELFELLMYYKWYFVISVFLTVSLGVYYVWSTPKTYSSSATILIKPDDGNAQSINQTMELQRTFYTQNNYINNEIGILRSRPIMEKVVEKLKLDVTYKADMGFKTVDIYRSTPITVEFHNTLPTQSVNLEIIPINLNKDIRISILTSDTDTEKQYTVNFGDTITLPIIGEIIVSPTLYMDSSDIDKSIYVSKHNSKVIANSLIGRLNISPTEMSDLITLSLSDGNVHKATDVINTLIDVYQEDAINDKNLVLENTSEFVDKRLVIIEEELDKIDAEIEIYKRTNKLTDITSESSMYLQSTSRLENEELSIENQLSMALFMQEYLNDKNNISELIPANIGIADAGVESQIAEYNTLLTERNKFLGNSSMNNPLVIDIQNSLVPMRASISKSVDNLIASLNIKSKIFEEREKENINRRTSVPTQQKYIISIERAQKTKEELYVFLLNKKEGAELRRAATESNCKIINAALGSSSPIAPNKNQIVLICIVLGLVIPSAFIYGKSLLNNNITNSRELKNLTNIPFLGELPLTKEMDNYDIAIKEDSRNAISEAIKILRDNVEFITPCNNKQGSVIQITSLNPHSGKTFIATNLAISIVLGGAKTIVLDLDLRRARISKTSSIGIKKNGLSQYLSGKIDDHKKLIYKYTNEELSFDIMPSGALPPNPAELIKSKRLATLIDELRKTYDYIILDNPPYSVVADAAICTRLSDQSIFIVRSKLFDKRLLPDLQTLYDSNKIKNMSIILNAVEHKNRHYKYGYGYEEEIRKPFYKKYLDAII